MRLINIQNLKVEKNMKKYMFQAMVTTTILLGGLSLPVHAEVGDWYVSGSSGYSEPTSKIFDDGTNGSGTPKSVIDSDAGYRITVGKQLLPSLKMELEYSTASYDTNPMRTSGTGARSPDIIGINANLDVDLLSLNVAYEFNNASKFTPFLKGGVGLTFYDIDGDLFVGSFGGNTFGGALPASFAYSGDGSEFAYFVGAGVDFELSDSLDIIVEYRYSDLGEVATDFDSAGDRIQTDLKTNDVHIGFRYSF
jgi:opacity protein-like surface antigen